LKRVRRARVIFRRSFAPSRGRGLKPTTGPLGKRSCFNPRPRAPVRGRTRGGAARGRETASFNPRPREGANNPSRTLLTQELDVSIRAPVRGRTTCSPRPLDAVVVSIRAPVRGRTGAARTRRPGRSCFNPRPREGANTPVTCIAEGFNPRPREGVRGRTRVEEEGRAKRLVLVRPLTGARIETVIGSLGIRTPRVRPLTGARIETGTSRHIGHPGGLCERRDEALNHHSLLMRIHGVPSTGRNDGSRGLARRSSAAVR
jgi:hypothetical protein